MTEQQVLAELYRLTGTLAPVEPATPADLDTLRRRLAASLFDLPGDGVSTSLPTEEALRGVVAELTAIVAQVALARASGAGPPRSTVVRRELPLRSGHQPEPFAGRSGANAVARSFGPLLEADERFVYFDLFEASEFVRVTRGIEPFLLLPADAQSADGLTFAFGAGSVWIEGRQLAPDIDGFVGLRVAEGTLTLRELASLVGERIDLAQDAVCTLALVPDPPAVAPPGAGPGQDAAVAAAGRPQQAEVELTADGARTIAAGGATLTVFGTTVELTRTDEQAVLEELTGGVLIPFAADVHELEPGDVRSTLVQLAGTWPVRAAGWLLPVGVLTSPDDLGEAADAGAVAVVLDGVRAGWGGLEGGRYAAEGAVLAVDSRELALVADGRTPRIARQDLALWDGSSLELQFDQQMRFQYSCVRDGTEALTVGATLTAHLDRPLQANGERPRLRIERARLAIVQDADAVTVHLAGRRRVDTRELIPLALTNALLQTTAADSLTAWGVLVDGHRVAGAFLRLTYPLNAIVPFLADPYAANFDTTRERPAGRPKAQLLATVRWGGPEAPWLRLALVARSEDDDDLPQLLLPHGLDLPEADDDERMLRLLFDRTLNAERMQPRAPLVLLDLSSNADQLGVGTAFPGAGPRRAVLTADGVSLSAPANDLRVVALPQVQWEPVRTHPPDRRPNFPQPHTARDDGGPLVLGVDAEGVHLVPIAPEPLLRLMLELAEQRTTSAAVRFTLPFGIKAVASLRAERRPLVARPTLALNQPFFGPLSGGLQFALHAASTEGIPGGAIQTKNSITAPPKSVLDDEVDGFFNVAFHPSDEIKRIPLSRIDLSGYGESAFSRWVNEAPAALDVTKVEFDVLVGRTAYEVVEIQSILWPCMARVVRRITIRREGNGTVLRRDSGWVAATPGLFHRADSSCVFHTGVVHGMFDIREIRDTPRRVRVSPNVELQVVYFDTDIAFEHVARGQRSEGVGAHGQRVAFVPSQRQLGFVQLIDIGSPQQTPLTPVQLAELLDGNAPVGGPLDCELDVGGSGQRMRVASVYSAVAPDPGGGDPHFAVAAFGAPELPREGQWSVVRTQNHPLDSPEPEPVDPRTGVPLVRAGATTLPPSANTSPYRIADPSDVLRPSQPTWDYALMLATQTFRVLFRRVKVEPGSHSVTADLPPVLADPYAMLAATGLFPRLKDAIEFGSNAYELRILGGGQLRLSPSPLTHTVPPKTLDLVKASGIHSYTEYRGGDRHRPGPATAELRFDSSAQPSWAMKLGPVSTVSDMDPFGKLLRLITTLEADSTGHGRGTEPLLELGGALTPVEELITVLKEFGIPGDLSVETPNSPHLEKTYKLKLALRIEVPEIHVLGKFEGEVFIGFEWGTKRHKSRRLPISDTSAEVELSAELEGKVQLPIIKPLYGGGLFRLQLTTGYDSETREMKRELRLAAAAVGSIGGKLAGVLKAEGEIRYGYVFVADFAKEEYYPGVLIGLAVEVGIEIPGGPSVIKVGLEAEVIGLIRRIDAEEVKIKAEFTIAAEIELGGLLDIEYTVEAEWDVELPMKAFAAFMLAMQFGAVAGAVPLVADA